MANHDPLIARLESELESIEERRDAIITSIEALTGTRPTDASFTDRRRRDTSVGDDKREMILAYIRQRGVVRQADIWKDLGINSGTASTGTHELMLDGEIEKGPKKDRSVTWRAVK